MATNYTQHPGVGDGDLIYSSDMTYDGAALAASGRSSGDDLNDVLQDMDAAIVGNAPTTTLDADAITLDSVVYGTEIPSATELTDILDQLMVVIDSNADKYTQAQVDALVAKLAFLTVTQSVDLDAIETNSNASKVITDFLTVTGDLNLDNINTYAAASKVITDWITVTQAVDLDAIETNSAASKVITDWITVTQAVDLDAMETKLATIEASADVTDAVNVAAAGAPLLSASNEFTNDNDFSAGTTTVATPSNATDAANKGYVDSKAAFLTKTVTLTTDQVKDLNSDPTTLIDAGGAGTIIDVISVMAFLDYNSATYANAGNLVIEYATVTGEDIWVINNTLIVAADDKYANGTKQDDISVQDNTAVRASSTTDFITGDSPITLSIVYRIADFS